MKSGDETILFECGPQTSQCRCTCGHIGERICDHNFSGEEPIYNGEGKVCGATQICLRCGLSAFDHSLWTGD